MTTNALTPGGWVGRYDAGYRLGYRAEARQGLEDGVVAVMAAMTVTIEESNDGDNGVSGSWACTCRQLGLDAREITERVTAAQRGTLEGATR
jgi:hypothetical protein